MSGPDGEADGGPSPGDGAELVRPPRQQWLAIVRGLGLVVIVGLLIVLARQSGLAERVGDVQEIQARVEAAGAWGPAVFFALTVVVTGLGFTKQGVAIVAGALFGVAGGTLLTLFGSLGGSALMFTAARLSAPDALWSRLPARVRRLDHALEEHPFKVTMAVRLFPFGSNLAINLLAGLSGIRAWPFFLGTLVGTAPQVAIFALLGSGMRANPAFRVGLGVVLFIAAGLIGLHVYRRCMEQAEAEERAEAAAASEGPDGVDRS